MVASNGDGGDLEITDDAIQYIVEEGDGLLGNRTVVEVAGDDDGIRLRIASDLDEIIKDKRLIVGEVVPLEELTEMPIRCVKNTHCCSLSPCS